MTERNEDKKVFTRSQYHTNNNVKYNLKFDKPDAKDKRYTAVSTKLPTSVDLVTNLPAAQAPYDQGNLGSCTAHATTFCYVFDEIKQDNKDEFAGSRLFQYYNTRKLFGDLTTDDGGSIQDAILALAQTGLCEETLWPYDESKVFVAPPQKCYDEAKKCTALNHARVAQSATGLKSALHNGYPVAFGFQVYSSFESAQVEQTGVMPLPVSGETVVGGHAVAFVGYDDKKQMFKVRNSWGTGWGLSGYFWMPYSFALDSNQCNDFWVVTKVADPDIVPGQHVVELNTTTVVDTTTTTPTTPTTPTSPTNDNNNNDSGEDD
jgi:C1A family cysteine protease